jgi:RNA polymerase sigma-70 factor (ECF subfamily)
VQTQPQERGSLFAGCSIPAEATGLTRKSVDSRDFRNSLISARCHEFVKCQATLRLGTSGKISRIGEPKSTGTGITGTLTRSPDTDDDLIHRAQLGDIAAFRLLAVRYQSFLLGCAYSRCRNRDLADDLAQETLIAAWRSLHRFDGRCRFSTWLFGILRNCNLKQVAKRGQSGLDDSSLDVVPAATSSPAQVAEQADDARQLREAVAMLPEEHRLVIELRFFAGASLEEIAAELNCPLGTVKSRLHHGLEKLRNSSTRLNLDPPGRQSPERTP